MSLRQRLKSKIRVTFGTSHTDPTDFQLDAIIRDITNVQGIRTPTPEDWHDVVHRNVPSAGTIFYGGEDTSDLNMLLVQILNSPTTGGSTTK